MGSGCLFNPRPAFVPSTKRLVVTINRIFTGCHMLWRSSCTEVLSIFSTEAVYKIVNMCRGSCATSVPSEKWQTKILLFLFLEYFWWAYTKKVTYIFLWCLVPGNRVSRHHHENKQYFLIITETKDCWRWSMSHESPKYSRCYLTFPLQKYLETFIRLCSSLE